MATVYDGDAVVNPVHADLGHGVRDLYDWLRSRSRPGRTRRVEQLTPPGAPRYEQLADKLRKRIFDDDWPEDASGPYFGDRYGVSQPVVQRAFESLEREGLLRMESGKRTMPVPRSPWRIEFGARLPAEDTDEFEENIGIALRVTVHDQPAVDDATAERVGDGIRLRMKVESASLAGAVTAALPVAARALGSLPIAGMSAEVAE
jgi:hypothetical protein